jgi:UDP-N-acetylmuramate dehydrogenase
MEQTVERLSLACLTTFHIGGRPLLYLRPRDYAELDHAVALCRLRGLPMRILGGGSNLLVENGILPFGVIHICSPGFNWVQPTGANRLRVGAGVRIRRLLEYCKAEGLGGLEFMAGIPGTLGGALVGNAGAWGCTIGERVRRVWCLDCAGNRTEMPANSIAFGYRSSSLDGTIVTEAELELEPRSPQLVARAAARYAAEKSLRHPTSSRSAGCVFKNPPGDSAGRLLDLCGLKGARIGGAEVSPLHANFICNVANATADDVLELIDLMRRRVRARFGIELELEIKHWASESKVA